MTARVPITTRFSEGGITRLREDVGGGITPAPTLSAIIRALVAEALMNPGVIAAAKARLRKEGRV